MRGRGLPPKHPLPHMAFCTLGQYCYELDEEAVRPGYPKLIRDVWGVEGPIDAAFTRINCQGKTYLFKVPGPGAVGQGQGYLGRGGGLLCPGLGWARRLDLSLWSLTGALEDREAQGSRS